MVSWREKVCPLSGQPSAHDLTSTPLPRRQSPSQDGWFGSSTWDGFISCVLPLGAVVQWTACTTVPGNPAQQKRIQHKHQSNFIGWTITLGLPRWLSGEEFSCQCRRFRFNPWVMKIPWRRKWQPTPVYLPGKSLGQRSLASYSPWDHKKVRHNFVTKQQ